MSKVAKTPDEVDTYARCTLLAASMESKNIDSPETRDVNLDVIKHCIKYLQENEFITLRTATSSKL